MSESYSERGIEAAARSGTASVVAEAALPMTTAREMIARLLPGVDADRLMRALVAERDLQAGDAPVASGRYDSEIEIAERELRRVREQFALGAAARSLQHAFNNPLTALLAEAQLLELESLPDEQRLAVTRILDLSRRLVTLSRRLGTPLPDAGTR